MGKKLLNILLTVVIAGFVGYLVANWTLKRRLQEQEEVATVVSGTADKKSVPQRRVEVTNVANFSDAAESAVQAVVYVKVTQRNNYQQGGSLLDLIFGFPQTPRDQVGLGSGVIIRPDGYIVTNNHVIAGADLIEVTLENNRVYPAKLVGTDPATDIALIKIEAEDLPTVPLGNSDDLRLGEWVLAIGSPYDLRSTITAGIVSAKGRSMPNYDGQYRVESFIQTDAAVNPGNSGGALVNAAGELVGINTSIISRTGSYTGYSFAVPVNIVSKVVDDFIEFGEVQRAILGVSIVDVNAELAAQANLTDIDGVYVANVQKDSPAERGGLLQGDVIKEVNLNPVHNSAGLQEQISRLRPGEKAVVTVLREGKQREVIVAL
ncbi:MAG: trypsin-like peptidase domain-containing protein [Bacteroidales bacterium]|nr:trypsin-like peptidase domain-containing protein [Bacteroidales bacterium]MBQ1753336.1 trypsin-like peptidase domain-containing protein [Bacteroidales bacterium]MBQ1830892.1 trypsin-like peptidase domain-containing protein [Bacteroidales bacterium]MBQ5435000.1 trypsin-like peptidase domain-containing protein [Bacteroidales bacterium]MBR6869268.1 trypsin-like peptidase domain-containing protein [Bacteroidales bacterium]